jgi:hypothetical protein
VAAVVVVEEEKGGEGGGDAVQLFKARLAAVAHEYGRVGVPVGSLKKKFAQVWRGVAFPSPTDFGLPASTGLLKFLEHFADTVVVVHDGDGAGFVRAVTTREQALGIGRPDAPPSDGLVREVARSPEDAAAAAASAGGTAGAGGTASSGAGGTASSGAGGTASSGAGDAATAAAASAPAAAPAALSAPATSPSPAASSAAPPVIIIGGGIGGLAVALALQRRGVRCVVYERDLHCDQRHGYGLTLSNATALAALGVEEEVRRVNSGCVSDCHWVFESRGGVLGYFGIAFTKKLHEQRGNLRVPRLVLRRLLVEQLTPGTVRWGWRLRRYHETAARVSAVVERVRPPTATLSPPPPSAAAAAAVAAAAAPPPPLLLSANASPSNENCGPAVATTTPAAGAPAAADPPETAATAPPTSSPVMAPSALPPPPPPNTAQEQSKSSLASAPPPYSASASTAAAAATLCIPSDASAGVLSKAAQLVSNSAVSAAVAVVPPPPPPPPPLLRKGEEPAPKETRDVPAARSEKLSSRCLHSPPSAAEEVAVVAEAAAGSSARAMADVHIACVAAACSSASSSRGRSSCDSSAPSPPAKPCPTGLERSDFVSWAGRFVTRVGRPFAHRHHLPSVWVLVRLPVDVHPSHARQTKQL